MRSSREKNGLGSILPQRHLSSRIKLVKPPRPGVLEHKNPGLQTGFVGKLQAAGAGAEPEPSPDHSRCEEKPRQNVDQGMSLEERRHRDEQFQ
jgi:hypothetical protein